MSIVVRYHPVGMTAEKYDSTNEKLNEGDIEWPADGLDYHVCFGPDSDNLVVSEIWDSREQWEAFYDKLLPALEEAGIEFSGVPDVFEVHDSFRR